MMVIIMLMIMLNMMIILLKIMLKDIENSIMRWEFLLKIMLDHIFIVFHTEAFKRHHMSRYEMSPDMAIFRLFPIISLLGNLD